MEEQETVWQVSELFEPEKLTINKWDKNDRPRERFESSGASSLSSAELLAILIGSGSPKDNALDLMKRILNDCGNSLKTLGRMSLEELMQYNGIGMAKAVRILAACELGRRRQQEEQAERRDLSSADKIYEYLRPHMQDLLTEECWLLLLDNHFKLKGEHPILLSKGGLTEAAVDVRLILHHALIGKATVIVIAHNHPSNNPHPSRADDQLTKQVNDACRLMRLHLADHLIITDGDYYSYRENGKL